MHSSIKRGKRLGEGRGVENRCLFERRRNRNHHDCHGKNGRSTDGRRNEEAEEEEEEGVLAVEHGRRRKGKEREIGIPTDLRKKSLSLTLHCNSFKSMQFR